MFEITIVVTFGGATLIAGYQVLRHGADAARLESAAIAKRETKHREPHPDQ